MNSCSPFVGGNSSARCTCVCFRMSYTMEYYLTEKAFSIVVSQYSQSNTIGITATAAVVPILWSISSDFRVK